LQVTIQHATRSDVLPGLIYGIIGLAGFLLATFYDNLLTLIPPCAVLVRLGVPCPACGATRTGIELAHFHVWDSLVINPLFFIIYIGIIFWFVNSLFGFCCNKNLRVHLTEIEAKVLRIAILLSLPINWLYLVFVSFR